MEQIRGRIALVTGASRGIGRASALALAEAGCSVAVHFNKAHEEAEQVAREIRALGPRALVIGADLATEAGVTELAERARAELGQIDILVNNAGFATSKPVGELGLADWTPIIAGNLTSAFLLTQAVLPGMRERRWGRIIMLSSIAAQTGGVIGPHYAASKAGMLGLAHSYASLLAKEGITSNAIAPALIDTDMVRNNPRARPELIPVGRFGTSEEVAEVVVMLARNGYITGQTINLNGGWYMS